MIRAVLDVNVIVAALLSPPGSPATLLRRWLDGSYELVVSPTLLRELERTLGYRKISALVTAEDARGLVELLLRDADVRDDSGTEPLVRSADPNDDYLISLASAANALLVSGDRHLLDLSDDLPIYRPAQFLALIERDL